MDEEIKNKWIDALRSGKYKQGKTALLRETEEGCVHCCLGVLCEITHTPKFQLNGFGKGLFSFGEEEDEATNTGFLPPSVLKKTGMQEASGVIPTDKLDYVNKIVMQSNLKPAHSYSLSGLNDSGWTFEQIANVIEKCF